MSKEVACVAPHVASCCFEITNVSKYERLVSMMLYRLIGGGEKKIIFSFSPPFFVRVAGLPKEHALYRSSKMETYLLQFQV